MAFSENQPKIERMSDRRKLSFNTFNEHCREGSLTSTMQEALNLHTATMADVDAFINDNNLGDTPLTLISATKQPMAVKKAAETDVGQYLINIPNKLGVTPLINAIKQDDFGSVYSLLELGANPNIKDINDDSPLHLAVRNCQTNIVKVLLKFGAQFTENSNNENVLHALAENKQSSDLHLEWAQAFVDLGCDINAQDIIGDTPLHIATEHGNSALVEKFLSLGADLSVKNHQGLGVDEVPALTGKNETAEKRKLQRELRKKRLFTVV